MDSDISLVILAAGKSKRFGRPKQLVEVGPSGETLLECCVNDALNAGFSGVCVVTTAALRDSLVTRTSARFPRLNVEVAIQETPPDRQKPWGTGEAVMAACNVVSGPFAVCNADDYYGPAAFEAAFAHLSSPKDSTRPEYAVVGYRVENTLTPSGGVSRALIETDGATVVRISEVLDVERSSDGIGGKFPEGTATTLASTALVSMNLWAFDSRIGPELNRQFEEFKREVTSESTEFFISDAINAQIATGLATVRCLPCDERWLGITYEEDLAYVREEMAKLSPFPRSPLAP